jgi:hypothetical protein
MKIKKLLLLSSLSLVLVACKKPALVDQTLFKGVYVINEGKFQDGTGTVTNYNPLTSKTYNNVFEIQNKRPLGNIAQSITVAGNTGYIVVNNADRIEMVDLETMVSTGTINGFEKPRYILIDQNLAYVSQWANDGVSGKVAVVDLATKTITRNIAVGAGPEEMLKVGKKIYVVNNGGFFKDNRIAIIDVDSYQVDYLTVNDNPTSILMANDKVYVLCSGYNDFGTSQSSTPGAILCIDPSDNRILSNTVLGDSTLHPVDLSYDPKNNCLYYLNNIYGGSLYKFDLASAAATEFVTGAFLCLGFDGSNSTIYLGQGSFSTNGVVKAYNTQAILLNEFNTGIIPTHFGFKH